MTVQELAEKSLEMSMEVPKIQSGIFAFLPTTPNSQRGFRVVTSRLQSHAMQILDVPNRVKCYRKIFCAKPDQDAKIIGCELSHKPASDPRGRYHCICIPLQSSGRLLGLIRLFRLGSQPVSKEAREILCCVAEQAGVALELLLLHDRLEQELEKRTAALKAEFSSISESAIDAIISINSRGEIISCNRAMEIIYGYRKKGLLGKQFTLLIPEQYRNAYQKVIEQLVSTGDPNINGKMIELYGLKKDGSIFPLELSISTWKVDGETFCSSIIRDVTEKKHNEEMIRHLAYYDPLTNLPNRNLFHDRLQQAISGTTHKYDTIALLMMDLDRFKEINDTLGHQIGNIVLREVGLFLNDLFKDACITAHLGGDEFAMLLPNKDAEGAIQAAERIIEGLEKPFVFNNLILHVPASVGIAMFPGHGEDASTLVRKADIAMHTAKKLDTHLCVYSPEHDQYSLERLSLINELRQAIDKNQLFLLYQPKIDLKTGKTIEVEALVRWQHPKLGVILPNQFIMLAEHTGIINQISLWILKESLRQLRNWLEAGLIMSVTVNITAKTLHVPQLLDQIKGLLSTWGVAPDKLRLEITEDIIMADPQLALKAVAQLTNLGVRFSIDDFGTGYSSLDYLRKLPVDEIKIDKPFVINMMKEEKAALIVRSIIELGHNLGLRVTAEGVENKETLDKLISLGCDAAHGYLICHPIPPEEFVGWLNKQGIG
jgi:diguanylate cyclase (GGDEF)-like protein/PAS domain S-box-containing protein